MTPYELITQKGKLTPAHHKELTEKRGFTDKTIKRFRLFSGGEYLIQLEAQFRSDFNEKDLKDSGIFVKTGKTLQLSPLLLSNRIIIPYLNKEQAYFIRPHKLGLEKIGIRIYQELNLTNNEIILTEGEFKAIAGMQYGFSTIAIPGIASFSAKHFARLVEILNNHKVRKINILFDNEVKDDPNFDTYKENPAVRYDTQFYAYYMAKELKKEGFNTLIAILPDGWRKNGKIDLDGALAQGKTKKTIEMLLNNAQEHNDYLNQQTKEVRNIILRKNKQRNFRSHIQKKFGKYVVIKQKGTFTYDEEISNFTLKIIATHKTPKIIRHIVFIDEFNKVSDSFCIEGNQMVGSENFATFCLTHGNYIWTGSKEDLATVWEMLFLTDDGRYIVEPDEIGWTNDLWLFGNTAIQKDGREMRGDENHIFWTENYGIKPVPLGVTTGRQMISEGIPYLNLLPFKMEEVQTRLIDTLGEMEANMCLGWVTSVLFMEEVFKLYGCFPFLFITGRRGSGKSTIAEWLMNFYGLENCGKMAADTTAVALQRYLAYYSSLPVFIDEYRNTKQVMAKNGFFRNVYNRQSAGKGIKSDFGVREAKRRGTLLFAGEETPEDNALLSRCIIILISEKARTCNHFNWFMKHRNHFSYHIYNILKKREVLLPQFLKVLNEGKDYFVKKGSDDRTAINYATVGAGYAVVFGEDNLDFAKWITKETHRIQKEYQDEQAANVFMQDLVMLKTKKLLNDEYYEEREGKIYLYFHGIYSIWAQEYRKIRGIEPFKASAIRDYLKDEKGFIAVDELVRIKGIMKRCLSFNTEMAPIEIRTLTEGKG